MLFILAKDMSKITIRAFTQGVNIPSTRFRLSQLVPLLAKKGIDIDESHAYKSAYPPKGTIKRIIWIFQELISRARSVFFQGEVDIYIFQREMISTMYTFERFIQKPKILDVDDAVWLRKDGVAINKIASSVDIIVCGNNYLASYFKKFNKIISIIPTAVDINRFKPSVTEGKVIGWSGGSSAFNYLYRIEEQLAKVLQKNPLWKLRIVADLAPKFTLISSDRVEYIKWNPGIEVEAISTMTIGLMPLDNDPWSKGKCSYKMLLYMACGLPVVVSKIGMNAELLDMAEIGLGVGHDSQWLNSLNKLMNNSSLREHMGKAGRSLVESHFSLEITADKWDKVIQQIVVSE